MRWLRRHRGTLLIGLGLVLAVLVVVLLGGGARTSTPVDPDNPGPEGAQALARVLADEGVDVHVARGADELEASDVGAGTTVLVTTPEQLGTSTADALLHHARDASVVVAGAGPGAARALGVPQPSSVAVRDGLEADCADPSGLGTLVDGLEVEVERAFAYPVEGPTDGCFGGGAGALLVRDRPGLVLLGAEQALTNDQVLRADNAAVALRLLGQHDRLVWYVPALEDLGADDGVSLESLLPRWIRPGLVLGALVLLALVVWRGRRLGPLATEPLPVAVKAIETTLSRGRLYRKAGDRGHAAEALRSAARTRTAERLQLGSGVPLEELVRHAARHTGRPEAEVGALLRPAAAAPARDRDLIALAHDLAELDREVRRT